MGLIRKGMPLWVQRPLATVARSILAAPLVLPVDQSSRVARALARAFATSRLNRKKLPRAIENLRDAFPEWPEERVHRTAIGAYEHLFQLGVELVYAPRLITEDGFFRHMRLGDLGDAPRRLIENKPCILITGHCGNWELIGYTISMLGFPMHAVYRPLDLAPLDAWVKDTRQRQGLTLVSKFGAMRALPQALEHHVPIGLVADQNGGDRGLFVPFFGRLTSTYKSIGLLALRSRATLICGFARRLRRDEPAPDAHGGASTGSDRPSMRYVAEAVDIFGPEDWEGQPDPLFYLTARYRRAMETMIRKVPEQYLWMHRIWRSRAPHERHGKPFPKHLREKLESLPWMTSDEVERIVDRSDRDARTHAASKS